MPFSRLNTLKQQESYFLLNPEHLVLIILVVKKTLNAKEGAHESVSNNMSQGVKLYIFRAVQCMCFPNILLYT